MNYFDNKSTNASAETFNVKIKAFTSQFRGVGNINFFLLRLTKLFVQSTDFETDPFVRQQRLLPVYHDLINR
ncbi:transposase [Sphingobacterium daejeonense]|uniref:Transposase n=1 Tax=Sphingobacterium daejeonense TaxID=371142 RepID=A0ABW3RGA8_9SPHI|nr:transposase [Sphingobacterium daejeonense]MCT1531028.1 transposase [Sphingobacterium daejeonense]